MTSDCIKSHCENPVNSGIGLRLQTVPNCPKLQVMHTFTPNQHISDTPVLSDYFGYKGVTKGGLASIELVNISEFI